MRLYVPEAAGSELPSGFRRRRCSPLAAYRRMKPCSVVVSTCACPVVTCRLARSTQADQCARGQAAGPKLCRLGLSVLFSNPKVPSLSHGAVGLAGSV